MLTQNYPLLYWKFPIIPIQHSAEIWFLFDTQSKELQADWLILENNEKANIDISMPYCVKIEVNPSFTIEMLFGQIYQLARFAGCFRGF